VVATADPGTLPGKATWYLVTNLPRPGGPREADSDHPAASLAEIVRLYGIRNWIEQSYKQVKDELGWADFQVRSDTAIRRHQALVNCAFSFCWAAWFAHPAPQAATPPVPDAGDGERGSRTHRIASAAVLAPGDPGRARLAGPVDRAAALVECMVERAPAPAAASPDDIPRGRPRPAPLHPELTNYHYRSLIRDVRGADTCGFRRYAWCMRYAQGGGFTAEGRRRRERVRLEAVERFEQRAPVAVIAAELRVSERSVRRWRRAWEAGGLAGLASRGQAARCRLDEAQLAELETVLDAGPLAAGWQDQRWTLARVRDLVARKFGVQYTVPGIWYLLRRRDWSAQMGARRAIERDDGAIEVWKKETWPRVKGRRRPSAGGSSSRTSPASR